MSEKLAIDGGPPIRTTALELKKIYHGADIYDEEELSAALEVLKARSPFRYYGPNLLNKSLQLEQEFARYVGVKHALAVSSGTAALHVALGAADVGYGDEVILSPICWVSPAFAVLYQDAVPIFADIEFETLNIDPKDVLKKVTAKTRAIIVVHYAGSPAKMDELMEIAVENNLYVIEDCSHAYGAEYKGRKVGSIGDMSIFSGQFQKQVTSGEGGLLATSSDKLYEKAYRFHDLGMYEHLSKRGINTLGYNYRITELQSAILLEQMKKIDTSNAKLKANAIYVSENLASNEILHVRDTPSDCENVHYAIPIRVEWKRLKVSNEKFRLAMQAEGTPVSTTDKPIYYFGLFINKSTAELLRSCRKIDLPGKRAYKKGLCPIAEEAYDKYVMIFNSPRLTEHDLSDYIKAFEKLLEAYKKQTLISC